VVIGRRRAAGARERGQSRACRRALRLSVDPGPHGVQLDEPREERRLLREPARQPLVEVVVAVDEPGRRQAAAAVDAPHPIAVEVRGRARADGHEPVAFDHQVAVGVLGARRVDGGDRAPVDDRAGAHAALIRSAASRTASMIFS
jgi:hypothetical protein